MGTFSMIPLSCFISLIFACVNCVYILYANLHVWKVSTLYVEAIGYQMESPHLFCTAFIEAEYLKWTPNSHVQTSLDSQLTIGAPSPPSKADTWGQPCSPDDLHGLWNLEIWPSHLGVKCFVNWAIPPAHVLISVFSYICTQAWKKTPHLPWRIQRS